MNYVPKDQVKNYPLIKFTGTIHVVNDAASLQHALDLIYKFRVIGFDTETKPAFKKGVTYNISVLQISSGDNVFVFQLNQCGLDKRILDIFTDSNIIKVGIDINNDLVGLKKIKYFEESNFIDLNKLAIEKGFKSIGAVKLSILLLGCRVSKQQRLSDWSATNLSQSQLEYAAIDAWICPLILKGFKDRLLFP